ncbi:MAG TPA: nicotinate-nucleotide--dimethylbenzimidazole phosphoribosyltransferase [Gaiellaceae bacterium]|jgi:nicotinate-nucleotide--dimethylbenzimidazole phosphoribosyltransferase|nr:nicotinate-nucleotide--dimethylbenzimidazole phosphoribosyltransferase [Gaiellaceae bacterium]
MSDQEELAAAVARIAPADRAAFAAARAELDAKTKPRGSLGRVEELACRIAGVRGFPVGPLDVTAVLAAADHGVAGAGVSAYPPEVTRQMLLNFARGGAAAAVLARTLGVELVIVDAGVDGAVNVPGVRRLGIADGTEDMSVGPALTRAQALAAIVAGIGLARELDADVVALGEMGIGNTTAAAALAAAFLGVQPAAVCGRGTGLDDAGLGRKVVVVERALSVNAPDPADPVGVLAAVGGLEIAFLVGVALGAASARRVVLLDGFITGVAALAAARLAPAAVEAMVAAHLSPEPGHRLVLADLGLEPLLDLGLRLGEGTGALLAVPLLRAAVAVLGEMATFAEAGVTDAGR